MTRQDAWQTLSQQDWDIIIVGGGITGVAVAQQASHKGFKVLLLEQRDFAWGSSSRSSKMVHGGLRYIAQGDIKLTAHSLSEREKLLKSSHGLVYRMGYHFVHFKSQFPGRWPLFAVVFLYNGLARFWDYQFLSPFKFLKKIPHYRSQHLLGATYYSDALTDDARLVLRVLDEAKALGAQALNYAAVQHIEKSVSGYRVHVLNALTHHQLELNAKVVVNATGAWAGQLREKFTNKSNGVRPQRGSHLVVSQQRLPLHEAIILQHPADKRVMFIYPWEGRTVIGTTDLDHRSELANEAAITSEEVSYLLAAANHAFPSAHLADTDIISTFSGVRPIVASGDALSPSQERRSHSVWDDDGLITVTGGKLTTFRLIALDVIAAISKHLKRHKEKSQHSDIFQDARLQSSCEPALGAYLKGRYGFLTEQFLSEMPAAELKPVAPEVKTLLAEMRWALRHEQVVHLDDLLLRRTRLGLLLPEAAISVFPLIRPLLAQELGWSSAHIDEEERRYLTIHKQFYHLPLSETEAVIG